LIFASRQLHQISSPPTTTTHPSTTVIQSEAKDLAFDSAFGFASLQSPSLLYDLHMSDGREEREEQEQRRKWRERENRPEENLDPPPPDQYHPERKDS